MSFLSRYEWIQFFVLYYISCAVDYIDLTDMKIKKNLLVFVDNCSQVLTQLNT